MDDKSGQAFPTLTELHTDGGVLDAYNTDGLTKREWFAGLALQGLLSRDTHHSRPQITAEHAVQFADALIAELAKPRAE